VSKVLDGLSGLCQKYFIVSDRAFSMSTSGLRLRGEVVVVCLAGSADHTWAQQNPKPYIAGWPS
jgi:hypothetical protein